MIYYRDRMCYIVLKEGEYMVQIAYTVPTEVAEVTYECIKSP